MRLIHRFGGTAALCLAASLLAAPAAATQLSVTITNTSPGGGVGLSPLWVGFHDGSFDLFNVGGTASSALTRVAEDGDTGGFPGFFVGNAAGTLAGGPAFPGDVRSRTFDVDVGGAGRYFSYASMVVVSNDFFVGNATPTAIDLSGLAGGGAISLLVGVPYAAGLENIVYDAGTEVNDFLFSLANGAFGIAGGQSGNNQGADENGVITAVTGSPFDGFLNSPAPGDLVPLNFNNASLYGSIARIDIAVVPEPASMLLLGGGLLALAGARGARSRMA